MKNKVILISIDGMRPDGVLNCKNPYVEELMKIGSYTLNAKTVVPSVTLPCHLSMFHSVSPSRHGITGNTYVPQVRPVNGLFEVIHNAGGKCGMYYGWEPLRDISRPLSLTTAEFVWAYSDDNTDEILTKRLLSYLEKNELDFAFLYMVETDEKGGHDNGWMSEAYLERINKAVNNVKSVIEKVGSEYTVIVTADHGGHDRTHGTEMKEDMTIPMFFVGKEFTAGKELENISLLDLAPTIAHIMGVDPDREWEGKSILEK